MKEKKHSVLKIPSNRTLIHIFSAILGFAVFAIAEKLWQPEPLAFGAITVVLFIAVDFAAGYLYAHSGANMTRVSGDIIAPIAENITLDLMLKLGSPVALCESGGEIIWYNSKFAELFPEKKFRPSRKCEEIIGLTADSITSAKDLPDEKATGLKAGFSGHSFSADSYHLISHGKDLYMVVLNETTETDKLAKRLHDEETVLAYIIIDNLEEIGQFTNGNYREASSRVQTLLTEWAQNAGGILKEYERDKFMFIFGRSSLDRFIENKFDILDKIREIRVGDDCTPVTVSIGISNIGETLAAKERETALALDLALQRGGDQVVVKNRENTEIYGGKTKTVQKRTKVRARVIANEFLLAVSKASNVIVMGHKNPDYDSFGACVGIAHLAMFCGVKVNIVVDEEDSHNIKKALARVRVLSEYGDVFVDRITGQDMLRPDTLLVITDVNNPKQFASAEIAENVANIAVIDHHRKTGELPVKPIVTYIEPSASSASELVSELLEQSLPSGSLHREEADVLYSGILLDTKQFSRNTGVRTFSTALYLRSEGANPAEAQMFFQSDFEEYMREAKFSQNVITYKKMFAISMSESDGSAQDRLAAAKAADKLLTVSGVMASFGLVRIEGSVHISARSSGNVNVQLILEKLGGGGYYEAAGALLKGSSIEEAEAQLENAIDDYMKNS